MHSSSLYTLDILLDSYAWVKHRPEVKSLGISSSLTIVPGGLEILSPDTLLARGLTFMHLLCALTVVFAPVYYVLVVYALMIKFFGSCFIPLSDFIFR